MKLCACLFDNGPKGFRIEVCDFLSSLHQFPNDGQGWIDLPMIWKVAKHIFGRWDPSLRYKTMMSVVRKFLTKSLLSFLRLSTTDILSGVDKLASI